MSASASAKVGFLRIAAAMIVAAAVTSAAPAPEASASVCPPGTAGCSWQSGDLVTYNQDNWGTLGTAASDLLRSSSFDSVYPNGMEIGLHGTAGNSVLFTTPDAVLDYLPASGPAAPLDNDRLDPSSTEAGVLGGYALALQLDVDFSDAGHLAGNAGLRFGGLRVCGLTGTLSLNGMTVREVLAAMNGALGGGSTPYSYDELAALAFDLAQSFESGTVSAFARDHLLNATSCAPALEAGDLVTYNQDNWGTTGTAAGILLVNQFDFVYPGGGAEIGVSGAAGFSAIFTSAAHVLDYLPADGAPFPLDNDLLDPVSTSSGVFGGYVLALQFDIDFSDAGHLGGNGAVRFGDLRVCGLTSTPSFTGLTSFNGMTVREILAPLNQALGGAGSQLDTLAYGDLAALAWELTQSFESGTVSAFAQDHLVNAASCPPPPSADLSLTLGVDDATPMVGQEITFTLALRNAGASAVPVDSSVNFTEVSTEALNGLDYVAGSASASQGNVFASAGGAPGGWRPTASQKLPAGSTATLSWRAVVKSTQPIPVLAEIDAASLLDPDSTPNNCDANDDKVPDNSEDDCAAVTLTAASPDTTPPTCAIVAQGKDAGGAAFIRFRVDDVGWGLDRYEVVFVRNASVKVDQFSPGALGPVYVLATAVNRLKSMAVTVDFLDRAGNRATCDPVVWSVARVDEQPQDETFTDLPQVESKVTIVNGDPGMRKVVLIVNGTKFKELDLRAGETRRLDVASAMHPGTDNTITVRVRGKKGATALIVIADIP
jgi:uncharacterized repeat protein (TIGR01451 family)